MKVGILGAVRVAQTIGSKLAEVGQEVMLGARTPSKLQDWQAKTAGNVKVSSLAEAAGFGEILILAVKGIAALDVLAQAGAAQMNGKILIDLSNSVIFSEGKPTTLFIANTDSIAEQIQRTYPLVKVVKTVNTVGASVMVNPRQLADGDHVLFISGNDAEVKALVTQLLTSWFGWRHLFDLGDITSARSAEMYFILWNNIRVKLGTPVFNIKIVQNSEIRNL
jgi:8-hydroxy-5-deazaflavin:NADPH oxidoreductase